VRGKAADTGRRVSGGRKLVLGSVWSAPAQVWMYFLGLLVEGTYDCAEDFSMRGLDTLVAPIPRAGASLKLF
jgi:hypothetical protein